MHRARLWLIAKYVHSSSCPGHHILCHVTLLLLLPECSQFLHHMSLGWPWDLLWQIMWIMWLKGLIIHHFWGQAFVSLEPYFGSTEALPWDRHTRKKVTWRLTDPSHQVTANTSWQPFWCSAERSHMSELRHSQQKKHLTRPQRHEKL